MTVFVSPGKFPKKNARQSWTIRMQSFEFLDWKAHQKAHMLFFDGASKDNPRVVGC